MRLLLASLLLAGCASLPQGERYEIVGYYPGWKGPITVDPSLLTVINYAFLDICWDGRHRNPAVEENAPCDGVDGALALDNPEVDEAHFERLRSLKAVNPGLQLVASVGGWTRSNRFSDMAANPATRANFIATTIGFLRRYQFDGIDLDWEYPGAIGVPCAKGFTCDRPEDKRNFVTLARDLRTQLDIAGAADNKKYLATSAAGADRKFLLDGASAAWMTELAASLDWINLMTYDYHGTWETTSGLVAPLYRDRADPVDANADATVRMYLEAGVPARKLTLGIPFYGKGWIGCEAGPRGDGLYQPCKSPVADPPEATFEFSFLTSEGYVVPAGAEHGFTRSWNYSARVPTLYNEQSKIFISYDDPESVREKARYVRANGLRGAMYWEIAADRERALAGVVSRELPRGNNQ